MVEQGNAAADQAGSDLLRETVDAFLLHAINYPWVEPWDVINHVQVPQPPGRPVSTARMANLNSVVGAALVIGETDRAQWAVDQLDYISTSLGMPGHWAVWFDQALIAAHTLDLSAARDNLREAVAIEKASRAGPIRPDWLVVPAVVAQNEQDYETCAALLEAARAAPIDMAGGQAIAVYRRLRRELRDKLEPAQLEAARARGRQLDPDTALQAFIDDRSILPD